MSQPAIPYTGQQPRGGNPPNLAAATLPIVVNLMTGRTNQNDPGDPTNPPPSSTITTNPNPTPNPATAGLPESIAGERLIEVNIGQRPFWIGAGPAAEARRLAYFGAVRTGTLVRGEQEIIDYFGIDALDRARTFMPDFFKDLPACTSDTNVFLKNKCQSVYQTLWMTKMSRTARAQGALTADLAALAPFGNDTHAMDLAQLNALFNLAPRDMMTIRIRELADRYGFQ